MARGGSNPSANVALGAQNKVLLTNIKLNANRKKLLASMPGGGALSMNPMGIVAVGAALFSWVLDLAAGVGVALMAEAMQDMSIGQIAIWLFPLQR